MLGTCVNYYAPAGDAQTNRITGSTLVSEEYACVAFGKNDADYSKCGLTIADTVLIAAGMRATSQQYDHWLDLVDDMIVIGDCRRTGKIQEAMRTGYCAGMTI